MFTIPPENVLDDFVLANGNRNLVIKSMHEMDRGNPFYVAKTFDPDWVYKHDH